LLPLYFYCIFWVCLLIQKKKWFYWTSKEKLSILYLVTKLSLLLIIFYIYIWLKFPYGFDKNAYLAIGILIDCYIMIGNMKIKLFLIHSNRINFHSSIVEINPRTLLYLIKDVGNDRKKRGHKKLMTLTVFEKQTYLLQVLN
jgi:hypothetical protein